MTAKQYLKQARYLDERINTKIAQVSSLHNLATKATSTLSDMPGSPTRNTHRMEDIIIKILMLENEINADIDNLVDLKDEILSVIKAVEMRSAVCFWKRDTSISSSGKTLQRRCAQVLRISTVSTIRH